MAGQPTPPKGHSIDFAERRRHPRFRPTARVELSGGGEVVSLPIADISGGGIRLELQSEHLIQLEIDEQVSVFLTAEGGGGPVFVTVPASVVRIQRGDPWHVALEWGECDPDVADRLTAVLLMLEDGRSP